MHEMHKELIIKTFRQTGLLLNSNKLKDYKLKIRDLLGIKVRD